MSGFPKAGGGGAAPNVQDEGVPVLAAPNTLNFVGVGVAATDQGGGVARLTVPSTASTVADEGVDKLVTPAKLNFVGPGVTAADAGGGVAGITIPGGGLVKANADADATFANSVANNALATLAVPIVAAAGDRLHAVLMCEATNNSGAGVTYTFTVLLGATTVAVSAAINFGANANPLPLAFDIWVDVVNPANAQRVLALLHQGNPVAGSGWLAAGIASRTSYGTAAENLAAGKNLVVQCQMGTAAALASITCHAAHLEWIPKG